MMTTTTKTITRTTTPNIMLLKCVLVLVCGTSHALLEDDYMLTFPAFVGDPNLDPLCPMDEDVYPCFCYIVDNHLLNMDCSDVLDESELHSIFSSRFPEPMINKLHFERNKNIQVLLEGVFDSVSFTELVFHQGILEVIERLSLASSFQTATKLDFVDNRISSFPFEDLMKFPFLTELYLAGNQIRSFPLLDSPSLERLSLAHNPLGVLPLEAFKFLPRIVSIDLDNTMLKVLHPGTFKHITSLAYLFLGNNSLTQLENGSLSFTSPDLVLISLSGNLIHTVSSQVFSGIVPGLSLHLDGNTIEHLPEKNWKSLLELEMELWLTGNPLICDCKMSWIFKNELFRKQILMTSCNDGTPLADLNQDNFIGCEEKYLSDESPLESV